jgi:hypothetical protein
MEESCPAKRNRSVVAVNELPVRPEYYPLLMLASGQKREEFLAAILRGGETYYLDYALLLNQEEVYNMAEKIGVLPTWTLEESVLSLIEHGDLDPKVVVQQLLRDEGGAELVAQQLTRRKRGAALVVQQIIRERGIGFLADSLDPAEKEALARELLAKPDNEATQRSPEERPQRRTRRQTNH